MHSPAIYGPGSCAESWLLDATKAGRGLTTHPTEALAQKRADEIFGPMPDAIFTIRLFANRTQVGVKAKTGTEPMVALNAAIAALEAERADLTKCPAHKAAFTEPAAAMPRVPSRETRDRLYASAFSALRFAASRNAITSDDEKAILAILSPFHSGETGEVDSRFWWKPARSDPFWVLEDSDGSYVRNRESCLTTTDINKALVFPSEWHADVTRRSLSGMNWMTFIPVEHAYVATPNDGGRDDASND
jgi:hypothetical protein